LFDLLSQKIGLLNQNEYVVFLSFDNAGLDVESLFAIVSLDADFSGGKR
jgi:hypothetical protein